jgi:hypothetical protein
MNALADRPDFRFARQGGKGLDRIIRHHIIKPELRSSAIIFGYRRPWD